MAKILLEKYPIGSYPGQKTAGRYINDYMKANLDLLAGKIVEDMQFLGLCCSSTFEVRTGKSTFLQQVGECYIESVNKQHKLALSFGMQNIVFNVKDLMKRAFELPKYSILILDENDEIDEHYYSSLAKELRRFFRKSGQLNLFILLVVPNFFELRPSYAIGRSNFLIDVKFGDDFSRGLYSFYNFRKKKELYLKGKKNQDYSVVDPDFEGYFTRGYVVNEAEYRAVKKRDLEDGQKDSKDDQKKQFLVDLFKKLDATGHFEHKKLCDMFKISERTGYRWLNKEIDTEELTLSPTAILAA